MIDESMVRSKGDFRTVLQTMFIGIRELLPSSTDATSVETAIEKHALLERLRQLADSEGALRVWSPPSWVGANVAGVTSLLSKYFSRYRVFSGDPARAFDAFWAERGNEILTNVVAVRRDVHFANIIVRDPIELTPSMRLRPATDADDDLVHQYLRPIVSEESVLEISYAQLINEHGPTFCDRPIIDLEAFRLATSLLSGVAPAESLIIDKQLGIARDGGGIAFGKHPYGAPVLIDVETSTALSQVIRAYVELAADHSVPSRRAARSGKFVSAALQLPPGDGEGRLLCAWIALEALFSPDSERQSSRKTMADICSFIGGEYDTQENVDRIARSYSQRSDYLHGRDVPDVPRAASDAIEFSIESLRKRFGVSYLPQTRRWDEPYSEVKVKRYGDTITLQARFQR